MARKEVKKLNKELHKLWRYVEEAKKLHEEAMEHVLETQRAYILMLETYKAKKLELLRYEN